MKHANPRSKPMSGVDFENWTRSALSFLLTLKMEDIIILLLIGFLYIYDIITYPIYLLLQRPWGHVTESNTKRNVKIFEDERSVVYRNMSSPVPVHVELEKEKIETLEMMLNWVSRVYGNKTCLGTREILAQEDEIQPNGSIFKKYKLGEYKWKTYDELYDMATCFGRSLKDLGLTSRKNIAIFAETRAEWLIAAHGCFKQNLSIVTIYTNLGDEALIYAINETEVDTVITSHDLLPKFRNVLSRTPEIKHIIFMEDQLEPTDINGYKKGVQLLSFNDVIKIGKQSTADNNPPKSDDIAVIMYTSGSTGLPKGVLLSHKNCISTLKAICDVLPISSKDTFLGFLPLAHIFQLLLENICLLYGLKIGYSTPLTMMDSSNKLQKGCLGDASVLKPTFLISVPIILDRISKGIDEKLKHSGSLKQKIFNVAYNYKLKWHKNGFKTPIIDNLIFKSARQILGGRVRLIVSASAPLSAETHMKIKLCLCTDIITGYGLTETCGCATASTVDDRTTGRVGGPKSACDVRIDNWEQGGYRVTDLPYPRGEVIIGGDNVSKGYYKLPDKTKEDFFFKDGKQWFRTGDIGEIHPDGGLRIIDRKKDLVKLQFGEYVSLGKVESELKISPIVDNICVYGDPTKNYTVALVVPSQRHLNEIASDLSLPKSSFEQLCTNPLIEKAVLEKLIAQAKRSMLQKFEIPAAIKLIKEQWSPDMGLVTAALKLKRKAVQERYQNEINSMYVT